MGLFVIAAVGALLWGTFQIGGLPRWFAGDETTLVARFDDVSGLNLEADVLMAGVPIGKVDSIRLEGETARVAMRIDDAHSRLPIDSVVGIRSHGLLGERVIEIRPGSSERMLEPGGVITRTRSSANLDQLVDRLSTIADNVEQVTATFRNVLGGAEGEESVREIVANIHALTGGLRRVVAENEERIDRIAFNLDSFSADAKAFGEENREPLTELVANLREASGKLNITLDALATISTRVEQGDGTLGKLVSDEELYQSLDGALAEARAALRELRRAAEEAQEQVPSTILMTLIGSLF